MMDRCDVSGGINSRILSASSSDHCTLRLPQKVLIQLAVLVSLQDKGSLYLRRLHINIYLTGCIHAATGKPRHGRVELRNGRGIYCLEMKWDYPGRGSRTSVMANLVPDRQGQHSPIREQRRSILIGFLNGPLLNRK